MDIEKVIQQMTFEEKANLLVGAGYMQLHGVERLGIKALRCADGPHGTRLTPEDNCTHFPNLCNVGCSWSTETARLMGSAIADECIKNDVAILLGPGINIKRHILGGRNFEYFSEDPVLTGELAAAYVQGLEEKGVSSCVKHYAVNNHEKYRYHQSVEVDERTMRELYLKAFQIVVEKAHPDSIMCAYNKVNAVYCSENKHLLTDILRDEWGFDGIVLSDWGAVHNISRAIRAGLGLQMPTNANVVEQLQEGLEQGIVTMDDIDHAVREMLRFVDRTPYPRIAYDRDKQHDIARQIAADGMVLLKNDRDVLPITSAKYKKVAVVGEHAMAPIIGGQGSAEIAYNPDYTDVPYEELKKRLPDVEFKYLEMYQTTVYSRTCLWIKEGEFMDAIEDCDLVVLFAGSMMSEETEHLDRRTAHMNYNFDMFVGFAQEAGKKVVVVLNNGGVLLLGDAVKSADSIVEMWLGGESAGGAVADVLCGIVNPSGKLDTTIPTVMRTDLEYPGNGIVVEYKERFDVGYRYYDKHPEEILYPFGHGLSYTSFEYKDLDISEDGMTVSFTLKNTGSCAGAEVVQLYVGDPVATVIRPIKELKKFDKIYLKAGEEKRVTFELTPKDLAYFNVSLNEWVTERGQYDYYIGASSRDIRLQCSMYYKGEMPYTLKALQEGMIG